MSQKQPPEFPNSKRCFAKFKGKHLCQSVFFITVVDLWLAALLKEKLRHRCFLVSFAKSKRTSFLQNTSKRLLLISSTVFFNSFMMEIPLLQKPVHWFSLQMSGLVYIHWFRDLRNEIVNFRWMKRGKIFIIPFQG